MRESPYPMISVEAAIETILQHVRPLTPVTINFTDALGFVLAEDIDASEAMPPFAASAVDGYAVIAADPSPVRRVIGAQPAGSMGTLTVTPGSAVHVMTGAPLPAGADAVVMIEHTSPEGDSSIRLHVQPAAGDNVRPIGQDLAAGQRVLSHGTVLGAAEIGLLATIGRTHVSVYPRPRVAVLSTGDELVDPHEQPRPGQIRDSNRYSLLSAVREAGGQPLDWGRIPDRAEAVQEALESALRQADAVLTSGGVSMGELDLIKPYLAARGTIHFGRVRARPGKPVTFATVDGIPVFAMPGFPVSALVSFEVYVRPALLKMAGHTHLYRPRQRVIIEHAIRHEPDRVEFQRAVVRRHPDGRYTAHTTGYQGSGRLLSMVGANALLVLPAEQETFPAGSELEAWLIAPVRDVETPANN
ncbi:MAG: molybdopterin molybdotransferase MoeA [Anaerolineae bacterium]|nr:molybdopterin molybdotransferase MoeA [Anaerolineae bacterium]MDW8069873.1 molybdopterin molybdotransferase MoeA [Anaerolineae bacterium]